MHFSCYKTVSFPNVDDKFCANSSCWLQWHAYFGILQRFTTAKSERINGGFSIEFVVCWILVT